MYHPGDLIAGKYRLEEVLGEGGMGAVWAARNMTLHVDVAIKLIHRDIASDEASQRLLQEARAAAQLTHPAIVRVHDFGETDAGDPFIVMERLDGESLMDIVDRQGCLPEIEAVQMILPIASALASAHDKGIVHRDLKPDNVIVATSESGVVAPKLVDFGVAKLKYRTIESATGSTADVDEMAARITQAGHLLGSPQYMSPEQARTDPDIDARSDVWGLAVMLYELICGVVPFDHEKISSVLLAILTQEPVPPTEIVGCDERLWTIIARGLEKDREERWQSVREMGVALASWLLTQGVDEDVTGRGIAREWLGDKTLVGFAKMAAPAETERERSPASATIDGVTSDAPSATLRWPRWIAGVGVAAAIAGLAWVLVVRESPSSESPARVEAASRPVATEDPSSPRAADARASSSARAEPVPERTASASASVAPPRAWAPPPRPRPLPRVAPRPAPPRPKGPGIKQPSF